MSGEGERRAQRGLVPQYKVAAEKIYALIAERTGVKPELQARTVPVGLNPDGCANAKDLADQLAWFRAEGHLQRHLDVE